MGSLSKDIEYVPKPKFLTAADAEMKNILTPIEFEKSLVLNILFQPEVLIPDSYCFAETIRKHIISYRRESLFEAAITHGAIRVAFRNLGIASFPELFKAITATGIRIAGSEKAEADIVTRRLQRAADTRGSAFRQSAWPSHSIGEPFAELVEDHLRRDKIPEISLTGANLNTNMDIFD